MFVILKIKIAIILDCATQTKLKTMFVPIKTPCVRMGSLILVNLALFRNYVYGMEICAQVTHVPLSLTGTFATKLISATMMT
jgi:hypothetical protein